MTYGLAIGLDVSGLENISNLGNGTTPRLKSILTKFDQRFTVNAKEIGPRKALLSLLNYSDIDKLYYDGVKVFNTISAEDTSIRRIIVVAAGNDGSGNKAEAVAQDILGTVLHDQNTMKGFVLYITAEVYSQLNSTDRDNYHSPVDIDGIKAHKRYSDDYRYCFVVSPIGNPDSPIRKRADFVFERYLKPACEATEFRAKRSDMNVSQTISPEMFGALESAPLVAVYLGAPPWNPNVMLELGIRINTKKRLFLLKDSATTPYDLPFDIKDFNCIDIPSGDDTNIDNEQYGSLIRRIRDFIAAPHPSGWHYNYPSAIYDVGDKNIKIVDASGDLEELFAQNNLNQKDLREVLTNVYNLMPKVQRDKFKSEQAELIGRIMFGDLERVYATVPMYFERHTKFKDRAFLPIIHSHSSIQTGLRLHVAYIEVTGAVKKHREGYYHCNLLDTMQLHDTIPPLAA